MRVSVIGGGAVGLCVAEALTSRGAEVTVFERDRCGSAASAGNAGWITPSLAIPVPGPGVIGESLRWLVDPSGPLWIRPTLSPAMLSLDHPVRRELQPPGIPVRPGRAAAGGGSAPGRRSTGWPSGASSSSSTTTRCCIPRSSRRSSTTSGASRTSCARSGVGGALERLSADDLLALEPALSDQVIGGVIARGDRRVRPEALCAGVQRALVAAGAGVLEHSPVDVLIRDRSTWIVESGSVTRRADAVVLAAGVGSTRLLAALGARLPIVAAKGYSRTYPSDPTGPRQALYLETPKVAISVFDGAVRLSGTLELGARSLELSARRLAAITAAARQALPGWQLPLQARDWAGMRSLTPDGLPFVGAVPGSDGIHIAAGHSTLGITLAPLTGELIAGQLLEGRLDELLAAFDPARAIGHRGYLPRRRATTGGPR